MSFKKWLNFSSSRAIVLVLAAALLFGASSPFSKLLLGSFDPIALAGFLYLGSGVSAWLIFTLKGSWKASSASEARLVRTDLPWLAGAVAAGGVVAPILQMLGLAQTPASTASLLLNFEAVATALLAVWLFKETVGRRILLAMALTTLAAILLSWRPGSWGVTPAALAILLACFFWGLDNNLTRHISGKDPLMIVGIKGIGAGSFSLLLAMLLGRPLPSLGLIALAMLLGAFSYGLSIQFYILALRNLGAARTSTLYGISPFIGVLLSFILLHEIPTIYFWLALPLMIIGAWLMVSEQHAHPHFHPLLVHTHAHTHPGDIHHTHEHPGLDLSHGPVTHAHEHTHEPLSHDHPHTPDQHHWHKHTA
jgi:drug/metabolite transporter (DMT)-like permease